MSSLRSILSILWQEKVTNLEALYRARSTSIETMILKTQLWWTSHVIRVEQDSIPRQLSEYSMKRCSSINEARGRRKAAAAVTLASLASSLTVDALVDQN
ncbi:hypothetical protein RRG08_062859 [Elysia crispata]|uniref:Uncharacterized protein n=1 Tax=Elysia crispata TaxID=231223 RepID=A0AAE0ZUR9_9GAST|nr:hypothetical protein RRG08_062859 [Elysia crispata]